MQAPKPDIIDVLHREGIETRQKGPVHWARCPLHHDKTPSFKVDPERQNFHCFGCGAHGDVIAFVQAHRKCSFREALQIMGIDRGRPYRQDPRENKKRTLIKGFRAQCATYANRLARELRGLRHLVQDIRTEEDLELRAWAYLEIPVLEYKLDVLCSGTDEAKYLLYKEAMANGTTV